MKTQNITLALPKDVLHRVKLLAVERQTSISRLLTDTLIELIGDEARYERARRSFLARLDQPSDLGTRGEIPWSRDSLHER